jgi:1-deoxy-D-xylulose-5-phosphate reductoisomerase
MVKKKVMILGCTGSIGTTALNMLDKHRDSFQIVAISAHSNKDLLFSIARHFEVPNVCLTSDQESTVSCDDRTMWLHEVGLLDMIRNVDCDVVLNAISGSSGLSPTLVCIESHKDIALANKESIVMGGSLLFDFAQKHNVSIFPVDSEHSTLASLLDAHGKHSVASLVITASGGPFRNHSLKDMESVTLQDALQHPTWNMGAKITIDSATLANKGLEVIEASYLFGLTYEQIEVVIHPQSVVHSLIRMKNGSLYAQLSPPDMSLPIMSAINNNFIELENIVAPLDFNALNLNFNPYDGERFPLLDDAFSCTRKQAGYPIAFNGANEIAVHAFMDGLVPFHSIAQIVHEVLEGDFSKGPANIEDIYALDKRVRKQTQDVISRWCRDE